MTSKILEPLFVVLLLLISMHVEIGLTRPYEAETDPGEITGSVHVFDVALQSGVQLWGALLILLRWRKVLRAVRAAWPVVGFAALAGLSAAWSPEPTLTLRRSALLLVATLLAVYLGERYTIADQVRLLTRIFCLMMLAILILRVAAPAYVVDYVSHPGAWKGLSAYKNAFGQYMATAVLVLLLVRFNRFSWLRYLFLVIAAGMLLLAQSASALFCGVLVAAAVPLWHSRRATGKQRLPVYTIVATLVIAAVCFLATHAQWVLNLLSRNSTLSGRTSLWAAIWGAILKHPMLGYGYDTFWASLTGEVLDVRMSAGWLVQRADNGFLELGLSLGMLGVFLFFLVFAFSFRMAIHYVRSEPRPFGLWPITYLCFFLLHNMSESTLLTRGSFAYLVFVMITTSLAVHRQHRAAIPNWSHENDTENELVFHEA